MSSTQKGHPENDPSAGALALKFSALQELANVGYWELDLQTEKFLWSSQIFNFFDLDPDAFEPTRAAVREKIHPDDVASADHFLENAVKTDKLCNVQFRIITRDGRCRWLSLKCRLMHSHDQAPPRIQGSAHDITASREIEDALRQERQRSGEAQRIAHFGYWQWHIPTGHVTWSNEVYRIFGLSKGTFQPTIDEVLNRAHPDDRDMGNRLIQQSIDNHKPGMYEMRIYRPTGEMRWFESNFEPFFDEENELEYIIGTAHDVTERKRAEHLAEEREQRLRVTLHSIGDGVIATDIDGNVINMNPVAQRLTGWSASEALGKSLTTVFPVFPSDKRTNPVNPAELVLADKKAIKLDRQTVLLRRDGTLCRIADSAAPIQDENGVVIGVVLVFRDITEEVALEEKLQQSQKLEAIGQLAGGVAHDFNNILGGIIGAAELLSRHCSGDETAARYLELILETAERASGLTKSLLVFSRKQPTAHSAFDMKDVVQTTLELLRNTTDRRIVIETDFSADSHMVEGDPSQLQSAFLNLCINAVHAMPGGGTIRIATETTSLDRHYCLASTFDLTPGRYLQIDVRDTGHGISPADLPRIFDPFFTTKEVGKGSGLGLAAVYGAVQQHKGAITVYSEIGTGTSFRILLPIDNASASLPHNEPGQPVYGSGCILVVDDEPIMRTTARDLLSDLGYTVLLAENGQDGLDKYREQSGNIDLVILDMIMPVMNGRDCFREIRKIRPDARVLLSSGFTRDEDVDQMRAEGLMGFVSKPFRLAVLSQKVNECIHGPLA